MNSALRYLLARSAANRARRALRALRRPWTAAGLVAALAYLVILARLGGTGVPASSQALWTGALGLMLLAATMWTMGAAPGSVGGPYRALLFPAPVPRTSLVNLDVLRSQGLVLANVLLWTVLAAGGASPGGVLRRAGSLWLLFTILTLHRSLVARVRGTARAPLRWIRRGLILAGLMLVAAIPFLLNGSSSFQQVLRFTPSPLGTAILGVFAIPLRPLVAEGASRWLATLPAAMLLILAHYALLRVLGPDSEPGAPEHLATGRALVTLRSGGASRAVAWKAMTALVRRPRALAILVGLVLGIVALAALRNSGRTAAAEFAGYLALTWAPILMLTGPQVLRTGTQRDASQWPVLRTLPVAGRQWLLGGALGGGAVLSVLVLALLLFAAVGTVASNELPFDGPSRNGLLVLSPMVLVPLATLVYLVQECIALFLPSAALASNPHGGPGRLGSALLNTTLATLLLALALVPVAMVAVAAWVSVPSPTLIKAGLVALLAGALLAFECTVVAAWLGRRFENLAGDRA